MSYLCPYPCEGKTEYGYCRYTWCINPLNSNLGTAYQGQGVQKAIITNADRIRAMSDEGLAEFMCHSVSPRGVINCSSCEAAEFCRMGHNGWLDWLRQEADDA